VTLFAVRSTCDYGSHFIYLRDLPQRISVWSPAFHPTLK